ncbi:MAG TPA: type IV conjugative transfer system protein TraE [Burkholderiales bacterium]|nr:type IV conjugative transfer system protein TraE [Burkholderiales bacterium]
MEKDIHNDELIKVKRGVRSRDVLLFILVITNLLTVSVAYKNLSRERTIITPPVTRETFWIDSSDADPKYLQEMSTYFVLLANNISPSNIDYQNKLFLNYVNPAQQAELKSALDQQAQRVKRNQLVTMFYIKGFRVDAASNKVVITGQLDTLVGDKLTSSVEKMYRIGYQIINGKLYITEYGEVQSANPWGEFIK